MEEYVHTNKDNGDQITLHIEQDSELGIWRVYVQGDNGIKPLHSSTNAKAARAVFDDVKQAMVARA